MRSFCWIPAFLAMVVTAGHTQAPAAKPPIPGAPAGVTAFIDVHVVPMDTERVLRHQTVLVEQGRIIALGAAKQVKVPAGATRIDGRGSYLIPGLADMHAHLTYQYPPIPENWEMPETWKQRLFLYVANGITTVRDMNHVSTNPVGLRVRALAAEGKILSPRLYIGGSGQWPHLRHDFSAEKLSEVRLDSIASAVAAFQATGHDFIKVYDEHGPVYDSVLAAARRLGIPAAGHVWHQAGALDRALKSGQVSIEHFTGYDQAMYNGPALAPEALSKELRIHPDSLIAQRQRIDFAAIPALAGATKQAGVWNTPTQFLFETLGAEWRGDTAATWPEIEYVAPAARTTWLKRRGESTGGDYSDGNHLPMSNVNGTLEARRKLITALQDSGAGLLLGTDDAVLRMTLVPGLGAHRELQALVRAGLTPYQALVTGTRNIAQFFGTLDETGTVTVGKRADLVLVRGNPLTNIEHTMQPAGVMLGGRWLPRADIDRRLAAIWAADSAFTGWPYSP